MAMIRLQPFTTSTLAAGTASGVLNVAATTGITRNACLSIDHATGGWRVQVVRVVDATHIIARKTGFTAVSGEQGYQGKANDLSDIPNGAAVVLEEQWVPDLYQDDVPDNLSIPTK
jgi:hypothetical protein